MKDRDSMESLVAFVMLALRKISGAMARNDAAAFLRQIERQVQTELRVLKKDRS